MLGHELCAEVLEVGAGVAGVAVGDRVVVHHHAPCGECRRCRRGHETLCDQFKATRLYPGGFAERVRVPADLVGELLPVARARPRARDVRRAARVRAARLRALRPAGRRQPARRRVRGRAGCSRSRRRTRAPSRRSGCASRGPSASSARSRSAPSATATSSSTSRSCARRSPRRSRTASPPSRPAARCASTRRPTRARPLDLDGHALYVREVDVCASYSAGPADMRAALELIATGRVDPAPLITHRLAARGDRPRARARPHAARRSRRSCCRTSDARGDPARPGRPARRGRRRAGRRGARAGRGGDRLRHRREDAAPRPPRPRPLPEPLRPRDRRRAPRHRRARARRRLGRRAARARRAAPGGRRSAAR